MGLIRSINPNSTENKNYERVQSFCQKRTMRSSNQFQMARQLGYLDNEYKSKLLKRVEMSQKAITTGNELKSIDFQFRMKS
jgi:hypothetical protein